MPRDDAPKTPAKQRYHHGDLRAALLVAAEAELAASGIEGFSLRGVAKRAGVSHAAPSHHFKGSDGLLTALAAEGFRRFLATQQAREIAAADNATAQIVAAGLGYVDFALGHPALFRLMFASGRPDPADPALKAAAGAAYEHLVDGVNRLRGTASATDASAMADVTAAWALAHGIADLLHAGRLHDVQALDRSQRDAVIDGILRRWAASVGRPPA